jgi:hypothetical protein
MGIQSSETDVGGEILLTICVRTSAPKIERSFAVKNSMGNLTQESHRLSRIHNHLRYPQGCWPGSPEWITQEKLFHLRAICIGCHTDVHPPKK